jgi:mannitol-1-phosphate 5-dehydrogenase
MEKRAMILGAGATGRGHIGELAFEAGWELVFVDKDPQLIRCLREAGRYTVKLCRADGHRTVIVDRFVAYRADDIPAIIREALTTPLCAAGVETPLNVICCENMQSSSTMLRSLVVPLLGGAEAAHLKAHVGFPDCMVSRVVPLPENDPLQLVAEDYNEWTVDAAGFLGSPVDLPAMELVADQETRLARKFFMHNGAHAVCGYWGFHRGHKYIHEAVADPFVLERVVGAIGELAGVVSKRYGLDLNAVREYGLELGARGAVAEIKDLILRVIRDPLRKLSRPERFTAPAEMALKYGLPCEEIVVAMAAVLHYCHPDDPQAVTMRTKLRFLGPEKAIPEILGLPANRPLAARVVRAYQVWSPVARA